MTGSKRLWTIAVGAAIFGAALGAGATWIVAQSRIEVLESRMAALDAKAELLVEAQNKRIAAETSTTPPPPVAEPATKTPSPANPAVTREFALIRRIDAPARRLVADYAQFLTGKAAADAAAKDGAESPPPNDYYIVNSNSKLRTLTISPDAKVRLTTSPEQAISEGYPSTLTELASQVAEKPEQNAYRYYWLTITNGAVTAIEEQYIP